MICKVSEFAFIDRIRVFDWDEIVHPNDTADDLILFAIDNQFSITNFLPRLSIPEQHRTAIRNLLLEKNFIDKNSMLLLDDESDTDTISTTSTWFEVSRFSRANIVDNDFGVEVTQGLAYVFHTQTLISIGQQLECALRRISALATFQQRPSRVVIVVRITRFRQIHIKRWNNAMYNPVQDFRLCFSEKPDHIDPSLVCGDGSLITKPWIGYDRVRIPENDFIDFGVILGFLRARMYGLYDPLEVGELNGLLVARIMRIELGSFPYRTAALVPNMCSFVEVHFPRAMADALAENGDMCSICFMDFPEFVLRDSSIAETCCGHIFHSECLLVHLKFMVRNGTAQRCPYCRHPWPHRGPLLGLLSPPMAP